MPKFYVTYQQRYINLHDKYSVVEADSYAEARKQIHAIRGSDFAFCYTEEQFAGQPEKYGLSEVDIAEKGVA